MDGETILFDPVTNDHTATGSEVTMMTSVRSRAARVARKAMTFAAPALVVGLLAVPQAYAIRYPKGPAGGLERSIDLKLSTITRDLQRSQQLFDTQGRGSRAYLNSWRILQRDFNRLIPLKDRQLQLLISRFGRSNQVQMFFAAATQRENDNVINLRKFLFATPYRPLLLR